MKVKTVLIASAMILIGIMGLFWQAYEKQEATIMLKMDSTASENPWVRKGYVNEFGEKLEDGYLTIPTFEGKFENSVTMGEKLHVKLIVRDSTDIKLKMWEYGTNIVAPASYDSYRFLIQQANGKRPRAGDLEKGTDRLSFGKESIFLHNQMMDGGRISVYIVNTSNNLTKYRFSFDASGYSSHWESEVIKVRE